MEVKRLGSEKLVSRKDGKRGSKGVGVERWENLDIWKLSDELAYRVYRITSKFPQSEQYGLTSQIRRAALSIPTNIVEGYSRRGDKELKYFLNISLGSLAEVKYLLKFAYRLKLIEGDDFKALLDGYNELGRMLWKFYEAVKN